MIRGKHASNSQFSEFNRFHTFSDLANKWCTLSLLWDPSASSCSWSRSLKQVFKLTHQSFNCFGLKNSSYRGFATLSFLKSRGWIIPHSNNFVQYLFGPRRFRCSNLPKTSLAVHPNFIPHILKIHTDNSSISMCIQACKSRIWKGWC